MNRCKRMAAAIVLLAGFATAAPVAAHGDSRGGRGDWAAPTVRFHFWYYGGPYWWPRGYSYDGAPYYLVAPPYFAVPPYVAPPPQAAPPVYIEREPAESRSPPQAADPDRASWFFCPAANGFYPYVRECPSGWERVPALPPSQVR